LFVWLGINISIGVVGAGVIGRLRIQSILDNPATSLEGVHDISRQAAVEAAAGTGARAFTDLGEFLDLEMDAVVVCSPPEFHESAARGALERNLHVLCEKPLSNTLEAGRRMVDTAELASRVLAVGFNFRYYPFMKFVKAAIEDGQIGELNHVRLFGGHDGLNNFRAEWQYKAPASGGGAMMDVGIHTSDIARYVMGEVTSVYGFMSESVWHVPGSEDNAVAVFLSPNGIPATYHATWNEWRGYQTFVEVYGTHGIVRGSYAPMQNLLITQREPGAPRKKIRRLYPEIRIRERLKSWKATALLSLKEELKDFVARISGADGLPLASGKDGLRALQLASAVRQSTQENKVVQLPPL
jgi:predicted dehydrogenase